MQLKDIQEEAEGEFIERSYQGLAYLADPAIKDWESACRGHAKIIFDNVAKPLIEKACEKMAEKIRLEFSKGIEETQDDEYNIRNENLVCGYNTAISEQEELINKWFSK